MENAAPPLVVIHSAPQVAKQPPFQFKFKGKGRKPDNRSSSPKPQKYPKIDVHEEVQKVVIDELNPEVHFQDSEPRRHILLRFQDEQKAAEIEEGRVRKG